MGVCARPDRLPSENNQAAAPQHARIEAEGWSGKIFSMSKKSVGETEAKRHNQREQPVFDCKGDCKGGCGGRNKKKNEGAGESVIDKGLIEIRGNCGAGDRQHDENRQRNLRGMPVKKAGAGSANGQIDFKCDELRNKYIVNAMAGTFTIGRGFE